MEPFIGEIIMFGHSWGRPFDFFGQMMEQLGKFFLLFQF